MKALTKSFTVDLSDKTPWAKGVLPARNARLRSIPTVPKISLHTVSESSDSDSFNATIDPTRRSDQTRFTKKLPDPSILDLELEHEKKQPSPFAGFVINVSTDFVKRNKRKLSPKLPAYSHAASGFP